MEPSSTWPISKQVSYGCWTWQEVAQAATTTPTPPLQYPVVLPPLLATTSPERHSPTTTMFARLDIILWLEPALAHFVSTSTSLYMLQLRAGVQHPSQQANRLANQRGSQLVANFMFILLGIIVHCRLFYHIAQPTRRPSSQPSSRPTRQPSSRPTTQPTVICRSGMYSYGGVCNLASIGTYVIFCHCYVFADGYEKVITLPEVCSSLATQH